MGVVGGSLNLCKRKRENFHVYCNAKRVVNKSIIKISSLVKNCLAGSVCDSVW